MILWMADDHYGVHPGRVSYEKLAAEYPEIKFFENDWSGFSLLESAESCELLILHLIADTCGLPLPDDAAAAAVRHYCETGRPLLLLHGGSAAFWHHDWFRSMVGLRWVRGNDPDGVEASFHPVEPYRVSVAKCRHRLCGKLHEMELPCDEIYTGLEQTAPYWVLMETVVSGRSWPQCTESLSPWGGRVINFLPGHAAAVTGAAGYLTNLKILIDDLLVEK